MHATAVRMGGARTHLLGLIPELCQVARASEARSSSQRSRSSRRVRGGNARSASQYCRQNGSALEACRTVGTADRSGMNMP